MHARAAAATRAAAADTPVEFATYQQKKFEQQGVGPFEQVATVLKHNGAKVVTGLTGRATLQTAQGEPISFEERINAKGNFERVVRGPNYRSTLHGDLDTALDGSGTIIFALGEFTERTY